MQVKINDKLMNAILSYGDKYRREYLHRDRYKKPLLEKDGWEALKFFFDRAFYQGRLDKVSEMVKERAIKVLVTHSSILNMSFEDKDLVAVNKELGEVIGNKGKEGNVGKKGDVKMVVSVLEFIKNLTNRNIVAHTIICIKNGKVVDHSKELEGRNGGIFQVGPKIASLYIRDVVSLFNLKKHISEDSQIYLQPVDVWVKRVFQEIGVLTKDHNPTTKEIRKATDTIIKLCLQKERSPLKFNQGAWYLGSHAFELIIKNLREHGV